MDERDGFAAVGVYDVVACKATLATKTRQALDPPATFEAWDLEFEGAAVLVAKKIHEQPSHGKPCRVTSSGKAYLRSYDGDYELSQVEEQTFIANRSTPMFDQQVVPGATRNDLHPDLLAAYLASCVPRPPRWPQCRTTRSCTARASPPARIAHPALPV